MTDEIGIPTPEPTDSSGPTAGEAWSEVLTRMNELGAATVRWARAAANDPENKQKLDQVRAGINDIAQKAETALGQVASSDLGQQFKEGAEQAGQAIGDAAQHAKQVAAPHVKSAFAGLSDVFGKAAAKLDKTDPPTPEDK